MSEFIENPFGELWEKFDVNEYKARICKLIDEVIAAKDSEEMAELLRAMDDMVMSLVIVLKLKDVEAIEVVKVGELPPELIEQMGFDETDMIDGYVPKSLIPKEFLGEIENAPKRKKRKNNNWLIDK